ncbi:hypothetical protein ACIRG4_24030 [Streptomyces sp. NPDC102395]|uniref:hypothetical protein n=1 Tax=Streptomyces sp. NPDC102395 TaxID=3366168 RepID=UPI00382E021F
MRRGGRRTSGEDTGGALVNTVEGYLLARAHHDEARREAEELCDRLPWLTTAQAEDVSRHYVRQRVDLTRRMLRTTVDRAAELRREYEARYAALRRELLRRHIAFASAALACAAGIGVLAGLFNR